MAHKKGLTPFFSVIVPVFDGGASFRLCLSSLEQSEFRDWELIVVDDGSSDDSALVASATADQVLTTSGRLGPAAARNLGAKTASGKVLFFLDADCSVRSDTLGQAAEHFDEEPTLDALFGSYDDSPSAPGLIARFKNLQHHFVHQNSEEKASTFWAGCGAIRRQAFADVGGFDSERFDHPSVEDIDLGYRLRAVGKRIKLAKDVQVKHHKAWTLINVIATDLFDRGIPWTVLLQEQTKPARELNLSWGGRVSVVLGLAGIVALFLCVVDIRIAWLALAFVLGLVAVNFPFYRLLASNGGVRLFIVGILMLWIHQLVCGVAYVGGRLKHRRLRRSMSAISSRPEYRE